MEKRRVADISLGRGWAFRAAGEPAENPAERDKLFDVNRSHLDRSISEGIDGSRRGLDGGLWLVQVRGS